jgi:hypothetical protein
VAKDRRHRRKRHAILDEAGLQGSLAELLADTSTTGIGRLELNYFATLISEAPLRAATNYQQNSHSSVDPDGNADLSGRIVIP